MRCCSFCEHDIYKYIFNFLQLRMKKTLVWPAVLAWRDVNLGMSSFLILDENYTALKAKRKRGCWCCAYNVPDFSFKRCWCSFFIVYYVYVFRFCFTFYPSDLNKDLLVHLAMCSFYACVNFIFFLG